MIQVYLGSLLVMIGVFILGIGIENIAKERPARLDLPGIPSGTYKAESDFDKNEIRIYETSNGKLVATYKGMKP